jgi:hypothetical protein
MYLNIKILKCVADFQNFIPGERGPLLRRNDDAIAFSIRSFQAGSCFEQVSKRCRG